MAPRFLTGLLLLTLVRLLLVSVMVSVLLYRGYRGGLLDLLGELDFLGCSSS